MHFAKIQRKISAPRDYYDGVYAVSCRLQVGYTVRTDGFPYPLVSIMEIGSRVWNLMVEDGALVGDQHVPVCSI